METPRSRRGDALSYGIGLGVFLACQAVVAMWPAIKVGFFCRGASWLAALFLGTPRVEMAEGFWLGHPRVDVHVVDACSGYDFFALLYAALCVIAVGHALRWWRGMLLLLPVAVGLTMLANACRIVCAVQARVLEAWLPAGPSAGAVHLAVGVFVFVTVLAASCHVTRTLYAKS